jgi:hypothetical protein
MQVGGTIFPVDLLTIVFENLDENSLCKAASVCKLFYQLSKEDRVWKCLADRNGWKFDEDHKKNFIERSYKSIEHKISDETKGSWPWHRTILIYQKRYFGQPAFLPKFEEGRVASTFVKDGIVVKVFEGKEIMNGLAFCPTCKEFVGTSKKITVIGKFEEKWNEDFQEQGEKNYLEIHCNLCKKNVLWIHEHYYFGYTY